MNTSNRTRNLVATAGLVLALGAGTAVVVAAGHSSDDQPIPVETDGGIGDTPIQVEPDGGIGDTPIQVEPDDGIGDAPDDHFPVDQARDDAHGLLGRYQDNLPPEVRVARKGDEQFALIENYVLGRLTVELDDDGNGYRVTSVTVELPGAPETFHLTPG